MACGRGHTTTKCEKSETVHVVATVTAPPLIPGPNYELLPELGYYKFYPARVNWFLARETCMKEGAYLLVLNSEKEFQAIKKMWETHPKVTNDWKDDVIHVGITDHKIEGQFYTIFEKHVDTTGYSKWKPGEPDSGNTVNCGAVHRNGLLYDSHCSNDKLSFVCEQQL
ncbi:hemolymph lipopolysaccharide-binding protein-like [Periplaneta americana]|uniref:hemolymph lipopolysaccharide-binding protein-like n=1 Tax=Periplaneta americana TaxID=6978 RepID=UPI0037E73F08